MARPTDPRIEPRLDLTRPLADSTLSLEGLGALNPGAAGVEALSRIGTDGYVPPVSVPNFVADTGTVDFMTGGNRSHNAEATYIAQQIARRLETEHGISVDPGRLREWVHQELVHFKDNGVSQTNGNVSRADWGEIIDHGVSRFAGVSRAAERVVETSEDMNWRIEDLIEQELLSPANADLEREMGAARMETLRATLRTRLRSEFASLLMNEWGSERLEDIADFLKNGIVLDFESRAQTIITDTVAANAVCAAE